MKMARLRRASARRSHNCHMHAALFEPDCLHRVLVDLDTRLFTFSYRDAVDGIGNAKTDAESLPTRRHRRIDRELVAAPLDAEDTFHRRAVQPAGGTGVPGPAAAPCLVADRI